MPDAALSGIELYQDVKDPNKRWAALSEFEKGLQGQYSLTPEQFAGLEAAGAKVQRVFNDPMYYNKGAFSNDILKAYQGLAPRAETEMTKASRGIAEKYLSGLTPQGFASYDLALNPTQQQALAAGAMGGANNPFTGGTPLPGQAYTPEQAAAATARSKELYPALAANPSLGYNIPNVIPQAKVEGQYLYSSDVLDKKANNAAVNALYNAYFNRDASAAELKNWGVSGGADTTVRALEDFLKQERVKYGVKEPVGTLGQIVKPVNVNLKDATTGTVTGGTTRTDVEKAMQENIATAPKSGEKTAISKLEEFLANQTRLAQDVQKYMQPSEEENALRKGLIDETARISGQPIQMAFIRGQQAVQDRKYQAQIALAQGDRQAKLDAAKFLYDANRNTLSDTISLYKATAPENIGTHIDEATGTMYVVTKNPLTGEVSTLNAGNVGAGKKYTSTSIQTDPTTNQMLFVGVKPDGSIETKALTQGGEKPLSSADRLKYAQDIVANSGYSITMEDALKQVDQAQSMVGTSTTAGVSRTDRNNNPTAMTTDVARTLGLVEGVDYVQGDPFQAGNSTLYTAKLVGDPFQTTIKALDNAASSGNKQAFYTQSGAPRWSHTAMTDQQWTAMSPQQKLATVQQMYQRENGTGGALSAGGAVAPTGQEVKFDKSPYQNAAQILRSSLPEAQAKNFGASLNQAINTGNADQAKSVILSAAISALPADQQNKAFGRAVAIDELGNVQKALRDFVAAGGNTGLIAGSVEGISQRIGRTSDPKIAAIGNQIQAAIVAYRSAVSGAAFTESEKQTYDAMFPSTGKTPALNEALITSLSDTFRRNQDSVLSQKIGSENYKKIFGSQMSTPSSADDILSEYGIAVQTPQQDPQQTQQPAKKEGGGISNWLNYFFGNK